MLRIMHKWACHFERSTAESKNLLLTQVEQMLRLRFTPLSMTKRQICVTSVSNWGVRWIWD